MRARRTPGILAVMTAAAMALAACTGGAEGKSGAESETTTVVLANPFHDGLTRVRGVEYFVNRLAGVSAGRMTVHVESRWKGGYDDALVLRDVAAGEADLGWAATGALGLVGVRELVPLDAPFLVDSYAAQRAVLADADVTRALHGVESAGLSGLALLADELKMPFGRTRPLLSPADYEGAVIRVAKSEGQWDGLRALGARPTAAAFDDRIDAASVRWSEYGASLAEYARFLTVNTPLWPRTVVLVANPDSLERLTSQEQAWLRAAAADAAQWSRDHAGDAEVDAMAGACERGLKVAAADAQQVASLEGAVQPFYEGLRADPVTAPVMRAVERVTAALSPTPSPTVPESCEFRPGDEDVVAALPPRLTAPGRPGELPEGEYRYELRADELRTAGLSEQDVYDNSGVMTWTMRGGRWSYVQMPANKDVVLNTTCEGYYDVDGSLVVLSVSTATEVGDCALRYWTARWTSTNGALVWRDVSVPGPDDGSFAKVWGPERWVKVR